MTTLPAAAPDGASDLVQRMNACADEVMEFPHPSQCDHLHVAHAVLREGAAEIERLRADAERYRWLRDHAPQELQFDHTAHECAISILIPCEWDADPMLDDAIDAAMKQAQR